MPRNPDSFHFKQFTVQHDKCAHKVGTDGVLLGAWVSVEKATRILEVGTGSGLIALMLAQRTHSPAYIDALEISLPDYQQAYENVANSSWKDRITVHHQSLQKFEAASFDLIVSNPPFFINSAKPPVAERVIARHSETLNQQELLDHAHRLLKSTGTLAVILPETEGKKFMEVAERQHWHCQRRCEFRSRTYKPVERLLLELVKQKTNCKEEQLVLYEGEKSALTQAYFELTNIFYL